MVSRVYLKKALRQKVEDRAHQECEYCLRSSIFVNESYHVDHVIGLKHGGWSTHDNLAWSCANCNISKGTDLATYSLISGVVVALYNPRKASWSDHFELLDTGSILGKTNEGKGTINLLRLNDELSVIERAMMLSEGYTFFVVQ